MAAQALANPEQMGHLWGDVPALLAVAAVLAFLTPRGSAVTALATLRSKYLEIAEEK
jgi:hypothetical protein